MLESIRIKNFQAHRDLKIELDPRVTTIIGPSDVGKSSVIRALRWVCMNVPVSSLIRDGAKTAIVELVADGHRIIRERGSENSYQMDGQEFKAFRTDVPDPIKDVMNLTESNFQSQHDPIYWFSLSAGEVSRQLNAVVNLDVIDKTLSIATRRFNAAKASNQAAEDQLTRAKVDCDALRWADDVDEEYKLLERAEKLIHVVEDDRRTLAEVANAVEVFGESAQHLAEQVESLEYLMEIVQSLQRKQADTDILRQTTEQASRFGTDRLELSQQAEDLEAIVSSARDVGKLQSRVDGLKKLVDKIEQLDSIRLFDAPDLSGIESMAEQIRSITHVRDQLEDAIAWVELRAATQKKSQSALEIESATFDDKVEGTCPVCGGKI